LRLDEAGKTAGRSVSDHKRSKKHAWNGNRLRPARAEISAAGQPAAEAHNGDGRIKECTPGPAGRGGIENANASRPRMRDRMAAAIGPINSSGNHDSSPP
jgi:hypothetical protein